MESDQRIKELEEKLELLEFQNQVLQNKISKVYLSDFSLFQSLFINMGHACVIYKAIDNGNDFIISDVNPACERIEGISKTEIVGKKVSIAFQNYGSDFLNVLKRVYSSEKAENFIFQCKRENGKVEWHNNDIFRLDSDKVVAIYEDISPLINQNLKKNIETEVAKSREKDHLLIQQSRQAVLGEMIVNVAHQWRQPLNEVSLLINDLEDAYTFGVLTKEYFEKTVEIVYQRLKFMSDMSDTINDFSKMHTDGFKKEDFSPKELIEKLIQFTEGLIEKNKIQIRFICNEDFEVFGYPNMLSHVLMNLLNNSLDILNERSIKKPKIWIKLERNQTNYCIRVLDNGKGIESDVIGKIFEPYFTTKDKKRGSGLGLYMAKSMIEKQMNGQIEVQNKLEGAEFKITLDLINNKYD